MKDELIGQVLGKYRIEAVMGGAGQARVYSLGTRAYERFRTIPEIYPRAGTRVQRG